MRKLFCATVLLFSVLLVNTALGYYGGRSPYGGHGSLNFDTDMLWMGGEILPGRPKFKLSQNPSGYSIAMGISGMYVRAQFSLVDYSVDFSFADYKGNIKWTKDWRENSFEGELELRGGRYARAPLDTTAKLKFNQKKTGQYRSPFDPYEIEITISNTEFGDRMPSVYIGDERIRDMSALDVVIKATINPRNWAESTANFHLSAEGEFKTPRSQERDRYGYRKYGYNYEPGTYNVSASFMIINLVKPSSSERQPKITMALDLETNRHIQNLNDTNTALKSWKKSILLDGMINLTGKGARLGVVKATDAATGNSIGRIQARREDSENLRLELFEEGRQEAAINYHENVNGLTNITLENPWCNGLTTFRIYERVIGDSNLEQRFYKDIFYIGTPCSVMKRELQGDRGMIWEEKMSASNDQYMYNVMVSGGYDVNNLYINLDNRGQDTKFQLGTMHKYRQGNNQLTLIGGDRVDLELKPSTDEIGEYDMKVSFNTERLFDGYFIGNTAIRRYAREHYPAAVQQAFDRYQEMHNTTITTLTQYV